MVKIYIIVTYYGPAVLAAPIIGYKDICRGCCFLAAQRDNLHLKNTPDVKQLRRMRKKRRIP
jgi:hypothetical protein